MGKKRQRDPPPAFATSKGWHEHFTPLFDDQLNSPAYIALTAVAKEAYTILRQEYKGNYTGNKIICPYKTFMEKGMTRNSISKAIRLLEALGFITYESGGLEHQPTIYHFSEGWKQINTKEQAESTREDLMERIRKEKEQREGLALLYGT